MEVIIAALFLYGVAHAFKEAGKAAGRATGKARSSAPKSGSRKIMADSQRRAATGWWVSEARKGFPVTRGGFTQGWREHTAQAAQTRADAAEHKQSVRQALEDHKRRVEAAQPPTTQPAQGGRPPGDKLPADQITQPKTRDGDHDMATCRDPQCACHKGSAPASAGGGQPAAPGSTNGSGGTTTMTTPSSNGSGDSTYEEAQSTIEAIKRDSESLVDPLTIQRALTLADGLPSMIPTDSETVGHVTDSAQCLQQAQAKAAEAAEHAEAAQSALTKNHGQQHEAVQSTGQDAVLGFHGVS